MEQSERKLSALGGFNNSQLEQFNVNLANAILGEIAFVDSVLAKQAAPRKISYLILKFLDWHLDWRIQLLQAFPNR